MIRVLCVYNEKFLLNKAGTLKSLNSCLQQGLSTDFLLWGSAEVTETGGHQLASRIPARCLRKPSAVRKHDGPSNAPEWPCWPRRPEIPSLSDAWLYALPLLPQEFNLRKGLLTVLPTLGRGNKLFQGHQH